MRLLNAKKLVIDEFQQNIPPYAILSHTWGDEEVSFVDFIEGKASHRKGYQKISRCCEQTIYDGLEYVWIDTCCIDKRSSVELSEAINSMFNWYRDSTVCYAYLEDVPSKETKEEIKDHSFPSNFRRSRWFTRGWTLQELLAPSVLVFYTSDWTSIGTRAELKTPIAEITHISLEFFRYGQLNDFSIAQRMSWAAHRQTTRIEDQAYCLLGIFGVTMPLVYGEGKRAFVRLQEEIIKESDDQSIFAWHPENFQQGVTEFLELTDGGLLSPSPLYFANSGSIGIQITLPVIENWVGSRLLFRHLQEKGRDISPIAEFLPSDAIAVLNCQSTDSQSKVVICLKKKWNEQKYIRRIHFSELVSLLQYEIERTAVEKQIFVQAHNVSNNTPLWLSIKHERLVIIEFLNSPLSEFRLKGTRPEDSSNDTDTSYITSVCSPSDQPDAPCIAIQNIETACLPNGTSPLALSAHAQCLCHGSYFAEWLGCRNCLLVHGALSPRNYTYFSSVLSLASQDLCTGTPTAEFATLFTQAQASVPEPTAGGTELSDVSSGDAACDGGDTGGIDFKYGRVGIGGNGWIDGCGCDRKYGNVN
ncbi:hypothetical protein ABKA04_004201 [Annulohypoxylon sp. FPYF3050]